VVSGFVEASDFAQLQKPALKDILFAPELLYGEPANAIRLPNRFNGTDNVSMEAVVRKVENVPAFYLVTEDPSRSYELWLRGRLGSRCVSHDADPNFGYVWIVKFACNR